MPRASLIPSLTLKIIMSDALGELGMIPVNQQCRPRDGRDHKADFRLKMYFKIYFTYAKRAIKTFVLTALFVGGRGWIRTTEALRSRFTVCPHWPLGNTPIFSFCSPWIACIYYHPDGSLSTSFAEFLDFCAESKNTKAKAAQKSTFLSGFLELVTGVERATGIASLKNGDFYTKICTFSSLFLVPSCTAHTPTKSKVC